MSRSCVLRRDRLAIVSPSFGGALLALALSGCLGAPPHKPLGDASVDAGSPPLGVLSVMVEDRRGEPWPDLAMPRRPRIAVTLTAPIESPIDAVYLLRGAPDEDLVEDAETAPLRVANRERSVPIAVESQDSLLMIEPVERLARGEPLTLLFPRWTRARDSAEHLDAPFAHALAVSEAAEAGTEALSSWPPDGAGAVSPDVGELWLALDGPLENPSAIVVRSGPVPLAASARGIECGPLGWENARTCIAVALLEPLLPGRDHALELGVDALDATGGAVGPWSARFTTAWEPDRDAPSTDAAACAIDEIPLEVGCALIDESSLTLRVQADEPVRAELSLAGRELHRLAPRGEAELEVVGLPAASPFDGTLVLTDLAGNTLEAEVALETTEPLLALSISEVRSDPAGAEPHQEYVEVLNYGAVPVDLFGCSLSDRADALGDVIERSFVLMPGQRALLVGDRFDPEDDADPPVPPGVALLRMGTSLASGGLSNAGEPLYLRDEVGRRLSAVPALATGEGACLLRLGTGRSASLESFVIAPCTPGRD
ncbi:MAG: hypothetical protein AB7S26_15335 [Sandaracinaceae bacterium]